MSKLSFKCRPALVGLAFAFALAPLGCGDDAQDMAVSTARPEPSTQPDIVATAQAAGTFQTLVAAVTAADLVGTLKGSGPFTVFAPTDAAFAKLPAGTVDSLLKPENKAMLVDILKYHVAAERLPASEVVKRTSVTTLLPGKSLAVSTTGGSVKVGAATVTTADVAASNGIIHVIDTVLLPQ